MPLRILAITGGRADWGPLGPPLALMRDDPYFSLDLAVTGQHLAAEGVESLAAIEADGFCITERIDMALLDDSAVGLAKSLGMGLAQFGQLLEHKRPDMLFVLGDRYELLAPVQAALLARIPVAHVAGGDVTEGAFDDSVRHSITKMSHLHFVTNPAAAARVIQLGESKDRVFNVGSPGLDRIRQISPLPRDDFFRAIDFTPRPKNAVVTFHPPTLSQTAEDDLQELLSAFELSGPELGLIFTGVNADPLGRTFNILIENFVNQHPWAVIKQSLGSLSYVSALTHVDLVIGNSSSGICEAPSFKIPTINVGDRQKGRVRADSVIDCEPFRNVIYSAIAQALTLDCKDVVNPYGDGHTAPRIIQALKSFKNMNVLVRKSFQDMRVQSHSSQGYQ